MEEESYHFLVINRSTEPFVLMYTNHQQSKEPAGGRWFSNSSRAFGEFMFGDESFSNFQAAFLLEKSLWELSFNAPV